MFFFDNSSLQIHFYQKFYLFKIETSFMKKNSLPQLLCISDKLEQCILSVFNIATSYLCFLNNVENHYRILQEGVEKSMESFYSSTRSNVESQSIIRSLELMNKDMVIYSLGGDFYTYKNNVKNAITEYNMSTGLQLSQGKRCKKEIHEYLTDIAKIASSLTKKESSSFQSDIREPYSKIMDAIAQSHEVVTKTVEHCSRLLSIVEENMYKAFEMLTAKFSATFKPERIECVHIAELAKLAGEELVFDSILLYSTYFAPAPFSKMKLYQPNYFELKENTQPSFYARFKENVSVTNAKGLDIFQKNDPIEVVSSGYSHLWTIRTSNTEFYVPSTSLKL